MVENSILRRRPWAPFVVAWGVGLAMLLEWGTRVDEYAVHVLEQVPPHTFPWQAILELSLAQAFILGLYYAILRPRSFDRSFGRALSAAVFGATVTAIGTLLAFHAAPPFAAHALWSALGLLGSVLLVAGTLLTSSGRSQTEPKP